MPYWGPHEAVATVLTKLGIDPSSRFDAQGQDPAYTACRAEELEEYFRLYCSPGLDFNERAVLCCFLLQSLNDLIQCGTPHPLQPVVLESLLRAHPEHSNELTYWSDCSDPDRENWWPIAQSIVDARPSLTGTMLHWDDVRSEFAWEGSWRDISVPGCTPRDWNAVYEAILQSRFRISFLRNGIVSPVPSTMVDLFVSEEVSHMLSVTVAAVLLNCHFFDPEEIEFDLDPREVRGQSDLDALVGFMRLLAAASGKEVLMTPENMHEIPFIRIEPSGACHYQSSGGFLKEVAAPTKRGCIGATQQESADRRAALAAEAQRRWADSWREHPA